jgi:hypothetical protein
MKNECEQWVCWGPKQWHLVAPTHLDLGKAIPEFIEVRTLCDIVVPVMSARFVTKSANTTPREDREDPIHPEWKCGACLKATVSRNENGEVTHLKPQPETTPTQPPSIREILLSRK